MSEISDIDDLSGMLPSEILAEITRRDAMIAALEGALASAELNNKALRTVLARYVGAVSATRYPKMDNSQWQAVIDLAHEGSIVKMVAQARAALAGTPEGESDSVPVAMSDSRLSDCTPEAAP